MCSTQSYLKDVVARYNIRNVHFLENLINYMADNVGSIFSAKKISDYLKSQQINISPNIVLNYLELSVRRIFSPACQANGYQREKRYLRSERNIILLIWDYVTVLNRLVVTDINKIIENVVYNHLLFCGFDVMVGQYGDKEIDFVCTRAAEKDIYSSCLYSIR